MRLGLGARVVLAVVRPFIHLWPLGKMQMACAPWSLAPCATCRLAGCSTPRLGWQCLHGGVRPWWALVAQHRRSSAGRQWQGPQFFSWRCSRQEEKGVPAYKHASLGVKPQARQLSEAASFNALRLCGLCLPRPLGTAARLWGHRHPVRRCVDPLRGGCSRKAAPCCPPVICCTSSPDGGGMARVIDQHGPSTQGR